MTQAPLVLMSFLHQIRQARIIRWLAPAVLVLYGAILLFCFVEQRWKPEWDSGVYLLTARALADTGEYTYLGEPYFLRPPALPWLLSFWAGGGQFDFQKINTLIMVMAILSVAAVYLLMRLRFNRGAALLITLFTGTSQLFIVRFNWIQSEFFFLALLFPAVYLLEQGSRPGKRSILALVGGALLLAAAVYFRSVGILLLPGALLVIFFRRRGRERLLALLPPLLVVLLVLPWSIHASRAESLADRPSEQSLLFSYSTALFHQDPGNPDSPRLAFVHWFNRVVRNGQKLGRWLTWSVLGSTSHLAMALLAMGVLAGVFAALARGPSIIDFFFVAYVLLLLVYFTNHIRLLLPLVPLLYAYLALGLLWVVKRCARYPLAGRVVAVAAVLAVLLLAGVSARHLANPLGRNTGIMEGQEGEAAGELAENAAISAWLKENTPEDARVVAKMAPIISVLSDREVYTWLFTRNGELLQRFEIDYIVLTGETPAWLNRQVAQWQARQWAIPGVGPRQAISIYQLKSWAGGRER